MLLLVDENFPLQTVEALRREGHDVIWVRVDAPGSSDGTLLERAEREGRVLLTLDRDFWQIAVQRREPLVRSGVILFRVHPAVPSTVTPLVIAALSTGREWAGNVSVATAREIRIVRSGGRS